jgi:hypothetical protein
VSATRRVLHLATLAGAAMAGLVGAHVLDYLVLIPDGPSRHRVLAATGHGYFASAAVLAFVAGAIAMLSAAAIGYRVGRGRERVAGAPSFRITAGRLAAVQVGGFVLLEATERLAAGVSPARGLDTTLVAGILIQVVVACLAAAVLALVHRAGEAVGSAIAARPHPLLRPPVLIPLRHLGVVRPAERRPGLVRGPPEPAAALP